MPPPRSVIPSPLTRKARDRAYAPGDGKKSVPPLATIAARALSTAGESSVTPSPTAPYALTSVTLASAATALPRTRKQAMAPAVKDAASSDTQGTSDGLCMARAVRVRALSLRDTGIPRAPRAAQFWKSRAVARASFRDPVHFVNTAERGGTLARGGCFGIEGDYNQINLPSVCC